MKSKYQEVPVLRMEQLKNLDVGKFVTEWKSNNATKRMAEHIQQITGNAEAGSIYFTDKPDCRNTSLPIVRFD